MAREPTEGPAAALPVKGGGALASVLVVDDQAIYREVMSAVVEATPGLKLVGEATSCEDALIAMDALCAEFVIVDVRMPGMGGLELARVLLARAPAPAVLLVSAGAPPTTLPSPVDRGVVAFVAKEQLRPAVLLELWERRTRIERTAGAGPHVPA